MLSKLIYAVKYSFGRAKVNKLSKKRSYDEALIVLSLLDGPADEMATLRLLKANILSRAGKKTKALVEYDRFLQDELELVLSETDRLYLRYYSLYYANAIRRNLGLEVKVVILHEDVLRAYKNVSMSIAVEFKFD